MQIPRSARKHQLYPALLFIITLVISGGCRPASPDARPPTPTVAAAPGDSTASPSGQPAALTPSPAPTKAQAPQPAKYPDVPYQLISQDSLFAYLQDLTSIQPYSGWRNTATSGEAEGLDYVAEKLDGFKTLEDWGMELERQSFKVFMTTEFWETRLFLTVGSREIEVPTQGLNGSRWLPLLAQIMDSDGALGDAERNPVVASGPILVIPDVKTLNYLRKEDAQGRVLFVDYALVDTITNPDAMDHGAWLVQLMDQGALGLVLVTQFSTKLGASHGTLAGDGSFFQYLEQAPNVHIPILHARLADLTPAGVAGWDDFSKVEAARLVWDTDVIAPAQAGDLVARIPGLDGSRAVILGAHIDSPNSPGAFDNGSGSAALLEIARVLNESQARPAVDLYLAWFGGHELGAYGSAYFASTHQELLDRTLAMLQMDCLGHPQDGKQVNISTGSTSYDRYGDDRLLWPDYLAQLAASQGIPLDREVEYGLIADNSNFDAFNVPNVDLVYLDFKELKSQGNAYIHYSMHWHDPYDTVELAREVGDTFVNMTKIALAAALETGRSEQSMRVSPPPERRALFVASHTETLTIGTSMMRDMGMALAWEGFDVDLIPYGQALRQADLENAGAIFLLPTLDYPGAHNETWSAAELALLEDYVAKGGFLVVTNSNYNYVMMRRLEDSNEDARDLNALLEPMGIRFTYGDTGEEVVKAVAEHPLMAGAGYLTQFGGNGVPIRMNSGLVLARAGGMAAIGLLDYGSLGGQVLVIADLGLLQADDHAKNMIFIQNLAHYARWRK
jgi:Peptidase family M28